MVIKFFKIFLIFILYLKHFIYCLDNKYFGTLILNNNKDVYKLYNITLHPRLNYPYLLKYNFSLFKLNSNTFTNKLKNEDFFMHFLDSEESIINLILNKSIDSLLSYNYLIITSYNNSKNVFESLLFQAFYINKSDYISIIKFINNNYDKNLNMSINFYYDNSKFLIPNKYIFYSKYIPLFSILLLLLINKIFFKVNIYYNICFNSAILRIICSLIYISLILEKLKYNKIKYEYMSSASIDYLIDFLNNFINDIYLSFIITSMIFIINNEINIINFFNSEDRKIKIYFLIFLLLSLINIPNYLYIKSKIIFHIFDILQIKLVLYEIFKVIISIYFINKQIKTISKILYIYSIYHLVINIYFLKAKKVFLYFNEISNNYCILLEYDI